MSAPKHPTSTDSAAPEPKRRPDVASDPARSDEPGHDWSTEGGATPRGPATDEDDDDG